MQTATTIPARGVRWRIPLVFGVTLFVNYLDRNNLALALPKIQQDFGWSDKELGENGQFLLAAFFLAYGLSNMFLSPLAERIGARRSIVFALAAFSLCTMLCGPFGLLFGALIVLRLLLGLGEGVHVPMMGAITSRWFPPGERSRANAMWNVGILVATALGPLLLVPLIEGIGWRPAFVVLGAAGMLISIPLVLLVVRDAPTPERVGAAELAYIETGNAARKAETAGSGARAYLRSGPFWLAVLGGTLNAFCGFGVLNWLPAYFTNAKSFTFDQLGLPLALVFASGIAGVFVMALLGDWLNRRILLASAGFLVAAAMVYCASAATAHTLLIAFFAAAVFCQSTYTAQEHAIIQRLLPADRVGSGTGLYNGLSVLVGGVGGSLIPGTVVALTGDFNSGILSIMIGAVLASGVYFVLAQKVRY